MMNPEKMRAMGYCLHCTHAPCVCDSSENREKQKHKEALERFEQERNTQEARRNQLNTLAQELFPENTALCELISVSYDTPQYGPHHREGMYMDTHLELIVKRVDEIFEGEIDPSLHPDLIKILKHLTGQTRKEGEDPLTEEEIDARKNRLKRYALLHDLAKKDCMTLRRPSWIGQKKSLPSQLYKGIKTKALDYKFPKVAKIKEVMEESLRLAGKHILVEPEPDRELTWEAWNTLMQEQGITEPDPSALDTFITDSKWDGISYFQQEAGNFHGAVGADRAKELGVDDELLLKAIAQHEVAFTFEDIHVPRFEEKFGTFTEEEIEWILTASYLDQSSALREDGTADYSGIENILDSQHNKQILDRVRDAFLAEQAQKFADNTYKQATLNGVMDVLRAKKERLVPEEVELIIKKKFGIVSFNLEAAPSVIEELVVQKTQEPLTQEQKERILELMTAGDNKTLSSEFGRLLGGNMKHIRALQK